MLKSFVEKIVDLKENKIHEINGQYYSDYKLNRIEPHIDRPTLQRLHSLDAIVKLIKLEILRTNYPLFIEIKNYDQVDVFTTYENDFSRNHLYTAKSDTPSFDPSWKSYESSMIAFRSQFLMNDDINYLLNLLSCISDENNVTSSDNGVTQQVEARKGIALNGKVTIKPIVKLAPFRTFLEVEQPESEFLVRIKEGGQIGLFEADGGMWKLKSKQNIKQYFERHLELFISENKVIVIA